MPKVSIIIPYQDVENYIERCLWTVANQTLKDIEIICVNDASTDYSVEIVKRFAQEDKRIKMLTTPEKSGQGYARNMGLKVATGEYVGFVDSDDWINQEMFEKLYNKAKEGNSDITMCQCFLYDDQTEEYSFNDYYDLKNLEKYGENTFHPYDTKDEVLDINVVLWNKIYRRKYLENTGEKFPEGFIYEDLPFFFGTYLKAERINVLWERLYYYRQNRKSSTMQNIDKKVYDRIPMVSLTYHKLKQTEFYKEKEIDILSWIIDDIFHRYTVLEEKYYKEYFYMMKKLFQSFGIEGDDKYKLATCYCFEEYCSILKNNYFDFWKFLIEKYKLANKKVKLAQHERNLTIKEYEDNVDNLKKQYQEESDFKVKVKLDEQFLFLEGKRKYELDCLYSEMHDKLVGQEYELKKWQSKSVKEACEKVKNEYEDKLKEQEILFEHALRVQKEYYENGYFIVKIGIKIQKKIQLLQNKLNKLLKKN